MISSPCAVTAQLHPSARCEQILLICRSGHRSDLTCILQSALALASPMRRLADPHGEFAYVPAASPTYSHGSAPIGSPVARPTIRRRDPRPAGDRHRYAVRSPRTIYALLCGRCAVFRRPADAELSYDPLKELRRSACDAQRHGVRDQP